MSKRLHFSLCRLSNRDVTVAARYTQWVQYVRGIGNALSKIRKRLNVEKR